MRDQPAPAGGALRPVEFEILLTLADGERHGYAIMQETLRRTGGAVRLEPGVLYRALVRMARVGWIAESGRRPVRGEDERRRYYRITELGRGAAAHEAERMARLVREARGKRLLGDPKTA